MWELGWFGVPQQGGSSTVKSVHAITYSYEGHSVNASIQGAQVTLYQTVKIFQGVQQATFSTKDVALTTLSAPDCKKHVVIFYHAVVSKEKPVQAVVFDTRRREPAFVDIDKLSLANSDTKLPDDVDLMFCHESAKKFLKQQIDTPTQGKDMNNTTQFEEEVYKSPSDRIVPDLQLTGSHTRTKREPIKKKQFSPEQKGVRVVVNVKGHGRKRMALGSVPQPKRRPAISKANLDQANKGWTEREKKPRKCPTQPVDVKMEAEAAEENKALRKKN